MPLKKILTDEGLTKTATMRVVGGPRAFSRNDWMGWAGAEYLQDGSDPWIFEAQKIEMNPQWVEDHEPRGLSLRMIRKFQLTQDATVIADGEGVVVHFHGRHGDPGPMFSASENIDDAAEAEAELKLVAAKLRKGVLPRGYRFVGIG